MDHSTSLSETSQNVLFYFCSIFYFLRNMYLYLIYLGYSEEFIVSLDAVRNQISKCLLKIFNSRSKFHQKNTSGMLLKFWPMKNIFQKLHTSRGFYLQNSQEHILFPTFWGILLPSQNKYSNRKTSWKINPNFFMWTKLLKNLLFAMCLIYVSLWLQNCKHNSNWLGEGDEKAEYSVARIEGFHISGEMVAWLRL